MTKVDKANSKQDQFEVASKVFTVCLDNIAFPMGATGELAAKLAYEQLRLI